MQYQHLSLNYAAEETMIFYCFFFHSFNKHFLSTCSVPGSTVCSRAEILRRFVGKDPICCFQFAVHCGLAGGPASWDHLTARPVRLTQSKLSL